MRSVNKIMTQVDIFYRRAARNTKILYPRRYQFSKSKTPKAVRRDVCVYLKPINNYSDIPFKNGSDILKLLRHENSFRVPEYESTLNSIYYSKKLKTFNSHELSLTNQTSRDLVRIMKASSRSIQKIILRFNRFRSLSPQECEQLYLKIFRRLKVLKNIESFELVLATFTRKVFENISISIDAFQKLKTFILDLPQFPVSFNHWEPLTKTLANHHLLQNLELDLSLSYSGQPDSSQTKFFDFLLQLENLETLSLKIRQKTVNNFLELSDNKILTLKALKKFSIQILSTEIDEQNASELFTKLSFPNINYFRVIVSRIRGQTTSLFTHLPKTMRPWKDLTTLVLTSSFCELQPKTFIILRQLFTPSLKILKLTIKQQSVDYECYCFLLNDFNQLSGLRELHFDFSSTRMHCLSLTNLAIAIESLNTLEKLSLDISHNEIRDKGMNKLANTISTLQNIKHLSLHLHDNNMSYISLHQLAESIKFLEGLGHLTLNLASCRNLNKSMILKILNLVKTSHPALNENTSLILIC